MTQLPRNPAALASIVNVVIYMFIYAIYLLLVANFTHNNQSNHLIQFCSFQDYSDFSSASTGREYFEQSFPAGRADEVNHCLMTSASPRLIPFILTAPETRLYITLYAMPFCETMVPFLYCTCLLGTPGTRTAQSIFVHDRMNILRGVLPHQPHDYLHPHIIHGDAVRQAFSRCVSKMYLLYAPRRVGGVAAIADYTAARHSVNSL